MVVLNKTYGVCNVFGIILPTFHCPLHVCYSHVRNKRLVLWEINDPISYYDGEKLATSVEVATPKTNFCKDLLNHISDLHGNFPKIN